ncbi:MAG: helix-turn-helix transcriptional regulator [Bacteroidales bacterium]|nr:helix-turn-helix transcriptional regulator [Bacteroidales bacterium]MDP3002563.1 helix-turn-helix transcriptional regulator [Bacteroidales bacterium]
MKTYSLEELTDKYVGTKGTKEREKFDFELKLDILGEMIKKARKEQNLTQEQLGELVGVQKAQISKIETNAKDVRFSTIMRVFDALKAKVKMTIEFNPDSNLEIA